MSKFRSMIVRERVWLVFPEIANLTILIKLGKGEENGGRDRDTILGDLFEAF